MEKQTTIAFVLIGAILMVWLYLNTPNTPPAKQKKQEVVKYEDSNKVATLKKEEAKEIPVKKDSVSLGSFFTAAPSPEKTIVVENDEAIIELSTKGGKITKYYLKKYNNWQYTETLNGKPYYKKNVQLLNYSKGSSFDLAFITSEGKAVSTADLSFISSVTTTDIKLSGKDSLTLSFLYKTKNNGYIQKNFTFYGDRYDTRFTVEFSKLNSLVTNGMYDVVWNSGLRFVEENSVDEAAAANSSVFSGGEQIIVDAPGGGEKIEKDFSGKIDWITIRNKYFAAIIAPESTENVEGAYIKGNSYHWPDGGIKEVYSTRLKMKLNNSEKTSESFLIYLGPISYDLFKNYGKDFDKIIDFGGFIGLKVIVRPIAEYLMLPLFKFLHLFIPNYGFVIIIFSLIIKLVTYPLTKSSMHSMKKMQMLQPKIAEIKEKFKEDPTKVNKETMKLYSTYGINPAGGCLPMLLQMPIFIALWGMFQTVIELRQQPFLFWIHDLSKPDIIYNLGFKLPLFGIDQISGLALLMGITTFIQQKQTMKDPQQQAMIYIMPVMLTFLFMSFPSGLNLYYFLFNLFSIAQQYYVTNYGKQEILEPVKNPKKKSGFMQRMLETAEQNAKTKSKK
ncbi:MAG: membrane protein insertase YidC [Ignavibacteria bacterium]|nr:membrane protein insertase YidC [Ignavibacteria bacterium]NCS80145.1 membrane protein insertase YidC [Ignavibacteria bacterium]OIO18062.1 MAG: preprotein translocase YidC [Ignavibacteria bacterium CG1_02_37_35]PIS45590.1 MAG: preprotein translocase YidC [Ignavibacteria bacterium CG08_land_8_20_14_0_20_37_9]PIX95216.1 MAG: preprotein translocase YidC [Ignavibacteria bacterium CG_4_10_14_3_um_filter_37_18]